MKNQMPAKMVVPGASRSQRASFHWIQPLLQSRPIPATFKYAPRLERVSRIRLVAALNSPVIYPRRLDCNRLTAMLNFRVVLFDSARLCSRVNIPGIQFPP